MNIHDDIFSNNSTLLATLDTLDVTTIEATVAGLRTDLTTLQAQVVTLGSLVDTNNSTTNSALIAVNTRVDNLQDEITISTADITALQAAIVVLQGDITTLVADMATFTASIDDLNASITTINAQIGILNGQLATINVRLGGHDTQITALQVQSTLDGVNIANNSSSITTLNTQFATLSAAVSAAALYSIRIPFLQVGRQFRLLIEFSNAVYYTYNITIRTPVNDGYARFYQQYTCTFEVAYTQLRIFPGAFMPAALIIPDAPGEVVPRAGLVRVMLPDYNTTIFNAYLTGPEDTLFSGAYQYGDPTTIGILTTP